ncbi:protein FAM83C [Nerophis lumbriciformis]|uniref:protein FAM83C n=1 Tax=Nerophis lumbriciformis TaxID=546530 RepID=UPI003BAA9A8B
MSSESLRPASGGRKPLGKLATRLEEVKSPWRQVASLELSHSEAARLATDALLEQGEREYRRVLTEERELSFLSETEIQYITRHAVKTGEPDSNGTGPADCDVAGDGDVASELTSGTYFPMMSDEEPPILELGWPDAPLRYGPSETQIYFQRDKSVNVKDRIRSLINKAKKVIALVMDEFTDVDLLCDLIEASNKRKVPVYILLDHKNLEHFTDMCSSLDVQNVHLSNMRIRSVCGDMYCTKNGKKFSGQVLEKFMIIDCEEVIAGSYSFTWLSAQVHSNMVMHFSGRITESFDREFRCLYADSEIIDCFYNEEEEGLPYFPPYQAPQMVMGHIPLMKANLLLDRQRTSSDNSSSQSSNSISSVKAAPGRTSNPVYMVNQGQDKLEPSNSHLSPERKIGERRVQNLAHQNNISPSTRVSANGVLNHTLERTTGGYSTDWTKSYPADLKWSHFAGTTSKFQALGMYEHKPTMYTGTTPARLNPTRTTTLLSETKLGAKQKGSSSQFLNKLSDFFTPPSDKDHYNFLRSQSPLGNVARGGPDLTQTVPESQQAPPSPSPPPPQPPPPPPPELPPSPVSPVSPVAQMTRQDEKRMTLGHSKLDLVNQYNQLKNKQVYSRFELKSSN